jgi:chromatin remodeling complex protein RSC6
MVRTSSKSEKQSAPVSVSVSSPVVQSVAPTENVVVAKTAAPKRAKKAKVEAAPAAVVDTPAVVDASVSVVAAVVAAVESTESPISVKMSEFSAKLQQLNSLFSTFKTEFKTLEKAMQKELRTAQKSSSKKAKRSGNRQPSGFVKPTRISDELARFLGKESGVEMARTTVSKEINQYIRTNSLQDKANGRKINPDTSLATLLKIQSGEELTYFNLQKYMKHHFVKASDAVAAVAV